jgi:hypothetical protein
LNLRALTALPRAAAFGIAVFPWPRELVIVAVLWLLLCGSGRWPRQVLALAALLAGLFLLRAGSASFDRPDVWLQTAALTALAAGICLLLYPWTPRMSATHTTLLHASPPVSGR